MFKMNFELEKLRIQLIYNGSKFKVFRYEKNEYNEIDKSKEPRLIVESIGLYHETNERISIEDSETTRYRTLRKPCILCFYNDYDSVNENIFYGVKNIKVDDIIEIEGKKYTVNGFVNIFGNDLFADVAMELTDKGV